MVRWTLDTVSTTEQKHFPNTSSFYLSYFCITQLYNSTQDTNNYKATTKCMPASHNQSFLGDRNTSISFCLSADSAGYPLSWLQATNWEVEITGITSNSGSLTFFSLFSHLLIYCWGEVICRVSCVHLAHLRAVSSKTTCSVAAPLNPFQLINQVKSNLL